MFNITSKFFSVFSKMFFGTINIQLKLINKGFAGKQAVNKDSER